MLKKLFVIWLLCLNLYASLEIKTTHITNVTLNNAVINIANLSQGQSGIVMHTYDDSKLIIVANAIVESSNNKTSTIKFSKFDDLNQNALPTTTLKPQNNDIFVLNYLYNKSLLIAPNAQSYKKVNKLYKNQTFLNSDIFASFLKLDSNPTPAKDDFILFCKKHNLGTIYFVIKNKIYIVDTRSFKVISQMDLEYSDKKMEEPFYTRVEEIKKGPFSWFTSSSIGNYTKYYLDLLGLKNDR
jgi:hypothetical protein